MLLYLVTLAYFTALVNSESVHWQWRDMVCTQNKNPKDPKAKEQADCSLYLKESEDDPNPRKVPFNPCFEENVDNTVRTYCDTLCPDADTVYRIFVRPQNHKTCHSHLTYRLERREGRHLMWRSGKCRSSDVEFTIRCEFKSPRADFPSDTDLFKRVRAVVQKA